MMPTRCDPPTSPSGLDLRDLVCLLLVLECGMLLRHGPRRDYLRREGSLPVVRGRLLPVRQVMRRFGRLDRLECRYAERSGDIPDNRLCAAARPTSVPVDVPGLLAARRPRPPLNELRTLIMP